MKLDNNTGDMNLFDFLDTEKEIKEFLKICCMFEKMKS